jgi:CheY-like chemotaxis protein
MKKIASILVVDDDSVTIDLLTIVLQRHGYLVSPAENGAEALKLCASQKFDLIITDILMPNVDGLDLITELKELNSMVPIIAMSGGNSETLGSEKLQLASIFGAHSTLKKPFTDGCLLKAVENALGS